MFIKLQKIREVTKRDEWGKPVLNPSNDKEIKDDEIVKESIDVFSIKSIRVFVKDGKSHSSINDEICVIYLKGGDSTPKLHVVADYVKLIEEVNELKGKKSN